MKEAGMRRMLIVALLVLLSGSAFVSTTQTRKVTVTVLIDGKEVMGFTPLAQPYKFGDGPGVHSQVNETEAKTKNGVAIAGFRFHGWNDADGYKVVATALTPDPDGVERLGSDTGGYRAFEFGSVHVRLGQEVPFQKMKEVGIKPWVIKVTEQNPR